MTVNFLFLFCFNLNSSLHFHCSTLIYLMKQEIQQNASIKRKGKGNKEGETWAQKRESWDSAEIHDGGRAESNRCGRCHRAVRVVQITSTVSIEAFAWQEDARTRWYRDGRTTKKVLLLAAMFRAFSLFLSLSLPTRFTNSIYLIYISTTYFKRIKTKFCNNFDMMIRKVQFMKVHIIIG